MAKKTEPALRITLDRKHINLRVLRIERITNHGFGSFLENVKPGEISIEQKALDALLGCRYRSGLQGMEIFAGNILAWGSPSPMFSVPLDAVSLHEGADKWLKRCSVVE